MNRKALVRSLEEAGCELKRHGAKHDLYVNLSTGQQSTVPRHSEIKDLLARAIRRQLGIEEERQ